MIDIENIVPDNIIREEFCEFGLPSDIIETLDKFLIARRKYIKKPDLNNRIIMKQTFDNIYHNTKYAFHVKYMTELDFFRLTGILRKGV